MILRNLRIAFAGEKDLAELRKLARATFRRTAGNLVSAAHTANLTKDGLARVIDIENLDLLDKAQAEGKGIVILLAHMGNWEILSRIRYFFPEGMQAGAFYRPLNNKLMDKQVLDRRQADGTRMFSKRDNALQVATFLREGGIVGILADQRVGLQGENVAFFDRLTRASPLPSLLARRSKSVVLSLSVTTIRPGKWKAVFMPVASPPTTMNCMLSLEKAMKASPVDVFWFQERWKIYIQPGYTFADWVGSPDVTGGKPHRVLLWLSGVSDSWRLPGKWFHPDVRYEVAVETGRDLPSWLPESTLIHEVPVSADRDTLRKMISAIDESAVLPLDYVITNDAPSVLCKACRREVIPILSLA